MDLPRLQDEFDGLHSWEWHGEDELDRKARIEALHHELSDCNGNIWEQMHRLRPFFEESELDKEVRNAVLEQLNDDSRKLFAWLTNIPYPGMQYKIVEVLSRKGQVEDLLKYMAVQEKTNVLLILCAYCSYISCVESQLAVGYGKPDEQLVSNRKERIAIILQVLSKLKKECYLEVVLSILSNEWIMDEHKRPCAFLSRNQLAKQVAEKFANIEEAREILHRREWSEGRAGVFGRLKLLAEWECEKELDLQEEYTYIWQCLNSWLISKDTYIFFGKSFENDNLMLLWLTAYLLHMDTEPAEKFKKLLSVYDVRLDGWRSDFSSNLHKRQQRYFLLTVGAMAAEWLHAGDRSTAAYPLYVLAGEEGILALRSYSDTTEHETNFWAQYWARAKMLIPTEKYGEAGDMLKECCRELYFPDDMLTVIEQMIENANEDFIEEFFNKEFSEKILKIIEEEMKFRENENEFFDKRIKICWQRYRKLCMILLKHG